VLLPNDPNSYYRERELVPTDMLGDIERAKIVITNYHAFRRREDMDVSTRPRSEHHRNRRKDAAACLRRSDGPQEHRRAQ
jgi:hypothetical protein